MDTFFDPYFHARWELGTGTVSQGFFHTVCVGSHLDHTHSLASLQWSGLSNEQTFLLTENCLHCQKMEPREGERSGFYASLCYKGEKWLSLPTKAFLQSTKIVATCTVSYLQNRLGQLITSWQSWTMEFQVISH